MIVITFGLALIVFTLIFPIIYLILRKIFKKDKNKILFGILMYIYIVFLTKYTIFPIDIAMAIDFSQIANFTDNINIVPIPFTNSNKFILIHSVLNIVMSIPFSIILCFIKSRYIKLREVILIGIVYGLCIEGIQFAIGLPLGYLYRSIDINDVIFNTIGIILGYILFKRIIPIIYFKFVDRELIEKSSFFKYISNQLILYKKNN